MSERIAAGFGIKIYMHRVCADLLVMVIMSKNAPFHEQVVALYRSAENIIGKFDLEGKVEGLEPTNLLAWLPVQIKC